MIQRLRFATVTCLTLLLTGCIITPGQFEALETRVQESETLRKQQTEEVTLMKDRLENLNRLFQNAKELLHRNIADVEADLDELVTGSQMATGKTEEIVFRLAKLERLMTQVAMAFEREHALTISDTGNPLPGEKKLSAEAEKALYEKGVASLQTKDYREARGFFQKYLDSVANGEHRSDAQYFIGEAFHAEGTLESALAAYQTVYTDYRDTARMPAAVLKMADIWAAKGECEKAKAIYEALGREKPESTEAPVAKERIKKLNETCKKK